MSTKAEKQLIDAKIAKVREVVRSVSNNDIVLALHSFNMDVNRTISAFTNGDVDTALGEWEKNGTTTSKKNKQKKKNKNVPVDSSAATSTTTETPKLSSIASSRPATAPKTQALPAQTHRAPVESHQSKPTADPAALSSSAKAFGQLGSDEKVQEVDSLIHQLDIKSARIQKNLDSVYSEQSSVILAIQSALNARERQLIAHLEGARREVDSKIQQQRSLLQKLKQNPKSADEFARVKADQEALNSWLEPSLFNLHGDKAVKVIEKLGSGFLPPSTEAASSHLPAVVQQSNGNHHQTPPKAQQPAIAQPQSNGQQQNGKPSQSKLQNGKPVNKALNGADIKHAISHSSLGSEENDSGLGQISPVSNEKSVAQVADGGFSFASDGLDIDQLAKIKAQVAETLKAQGIDPELLASIGSSDASGFTAAASRRRNNQNRKDHAKPPLNKENKKPAGKPVKS